MRTYKCPNVIIKSSKSQTCSFCKQIYLFSRLPPTWASCETHYRRGKSVYVPASSNKLLHLYGLIYHDSLLTFPDLMAGIGIVHYARRSQTAVVTCGLVELSTSWRLIVCGGLSRTPHTSCTQHHNSYHVIPYRCRCANRSAVQLPAAMPTAREIVCSHPFVSQRSSPGEFGSYFPMLILFVV